MKNRTDKKKIFRIVYLALSIWWTLVFLMAFLQAYFMSQKMIFILLIIVTPFVSWVVLKWFYRQIIKGRSWTKIPVYAFALINFIPLLLQLLGARNPSIDTVIAGLIGFFIIWNLEDNY